MQEFAHAKSADQCLPSIRIATAEQIRLLLAGLQDISIGISVREKTVTLDLSSAVQSSINHEAVLYP